MQAPPIRIARIRLAQGQIFWREVGKGPTIIFLHGALTNGSQWLPILDQLGGRYHCIAPDLLGCGESESPAAAQSIHLQAECLADYIEALHLGDVYLVGHSMGAWIASHYAIAHPRRVAGMLLLAPEGVDLPDRRQRWSRELQLTSPFPLIPWGLMGLKPLAKLFNRHHQITQLLAYRDQLIACPTSCQLLFQRQESEISPELLNDHLGDLKTKILVLQGGQDHPMQILQSKIYTKLAPYARLRILKNGGWDLVEEWSEQVAREIEQFLVTTVTRQ
ncbi:MAG: alpha/beta hydrolase [Spirulina sp. DLM2.Bin59]|nr:MAG: alpha/beta hydrolase [Spirulina sp. DLM2.Bin59]